MKTVISLVSALFTGLMLKGLIEQRRRIVASIALATSGFALILVGALLAIIHAAIQWDAAGALSWSAVMAVAVFLITAGAFMTLAARLVFPVIHQPVDTLFAGFDPALIPQLIAQFTQGLNLGMQSTPSPMSRSGANPPSASSEGPVQNNPAYAASVGHA